LDFARMMAQPLDEQRLAATIMLLGGLPAFAVRALARVQLLARRRAQQPSLTASGDLSQAH
jgi:hypothetical protein